MKLLTTILQPSQLITQFPQITAHADADKLQLFIEEAEFKYVKEKITDPLYIDLINYLNSGDKTAFPAEYQILLDGGVYQNIQTQGCNTRETGERIFKGLLSAIGYYTFSICIMRGDMNITRFGSVYKSEEHSENIDWKRKVHDEKEALKTADIYIADCISFVQSNRVKFVKFSRPVLKNRLNLTVIN